MATSGVVQSGQKCHLVKGRAVRSAESYQLDQTDRDILLALDEDPRMPVLLIAQRTGYARGTVQARLERYREHGLLRLSSTRVPPAALGRGLAATVSAELDQHQLESAVAALRRIPEVLECFAPAGGTDLLCRVVATDPDDLYRVSEEIRLCPGIVRTSTSVFLREVVGYRMRPLLEDNREPAGRGAKPRLGQGRTRAATTTRPAPGAGRRRGVE
ncbi:Lrp/AsnC family transcriptional regulator [Luteococcus sp. Sow4_B9]|uniref:Lrp/AsnC family transcriptional regulator n=1 Tax=Luteococcus sp. Sow4_B9 TaxID=3438792 RepID=UPI003F95F3F5